MIRDWNIIHRILADVEAGRIITTLEDIEPDQYHVFIDHIELLEDASLVKDLLEDVDRGDVPTDARLTMEGYDLLEVLRDETVQRAIEKELPLTFVGLIEYARRMVA